ncbi:MAG: threonylcarbamoyl-AMP synthase [Syntrophus sp. (in: bacteria)]|nr:threonylcarbamoyl-AMP synthase [Syntrophus sp. (in: bacteria)]
MKILDSSKPSSIEQAVETLQNGEIVAFPTETVYGLGADALNPVAVARIFEIKKRPRFDPLIVHIGEKDWIFKCAETIPPKAIELMERFWPGPLTIILKKSRLIPDIVTAGLSTVGIRMPSHPVALELITRLGRPIAAPSANPFGYMSPTKAVHVANMFKDTPLIILDGGNSSFGIESTIVSVSENSIRLHRHGAISIEDISSTAGPLSEKGDSGLCESPGELPYHYAPHKPLKIIRSFLEIETSQSSFLAFMPPQGKVPSKHIKTLCEKGDMREAAARFFSCLIELDQDDVDIIYAEEIPDTGLGKAMMERLRKASKKYSS